MFRGDRTDERRLHRLRRNPALERRNRSGKITARELPVPADCSVAREDEAAKALVELVDHALEAQRSGRHAVRDGLLVRGTAQVRERDEDERERGGDEQREHADRADDAGDDRCGCGIVGRALVPRSEPTACPADHRLTRRPRAAPPPSVRARRGRTAWGRTPRRLPRSPPGGRPHPRTRRSRRSGRGAARCRPSGSG